MSNTNTPQAAVEITTNLFSEYKLPTREARYEFAKFRERATKLKTRDLYSIFIANRDAVAEYSGQPSLNAHCVSAAARRDFCAAVLNGLRGLRFDYDTNDFPHA